MIACHERRQRDLSGIRRLLGALALRVCISYFPRIRALGETAVPGGGAAVSGGWGVALVERPRLVSAESDGERVEVVGIAQPVQVRWP
jgi:hypothetical protein